MQKVSKQSLAMLALSILLAISIALTFTFAALSATKTATGTITFGNGFTLESANFSGSGNDTFTVTPTFADNGAITYALNEKTAQWTITNNGTSNLNLGVTITLTKDSGNDEIVSLKSDLKSGTQYGVTVGNAGTVTIVLNDIINLATDDTASTVTSDVVEYTIKIDVVVVSTPIETTSSLITAA